MPNFQLFLDGGFRDYSGLPSATTASRFCHKVIRKNGKKAYSINAYEYQPIEFPNGNKSELSITCKAEFYQGIEPEDLPNPWFTVQMYDCEYWPLAYIYEFFDKVYTKMNCIPGIHNND